MSRSPLSLLKSVAFGNGLVPTQHLAVMTRSFPIYAAQKRPKLPTWDQDSLFYGPAQGQQNHQGFW
jgi:hypothetical protein